MMQIIRDKNRDQGFTLIEIIITLVVLSVAAIGVLSVFTTGIAGSADPLIVSKATQLAQEKLDSIIGDRLNPARGFGWITAANYPAENPIAGFSSFNRSVEIICVASADLNTSISCPRSYERVTVTVTWNTGAGSVSLATILANYP